MLRIGYRLVLVALSALLVIPAALPVEIADSAKRKRFKAVTRTFTQADDLTIPTVGTADPYPSPLTVRGFRKGRITDVNLRLINLSHDFSGDLEVLLVKGTSKGRTNRATAVVMSDAGPLIAGVFRPTDHNDGGADVFPAPAPAPSGNTALAAFDGLNPNGQWRLFVVDEFTGSEGGIASWELEITARVKAKKKR